MCKLKKAFYGLKQAPQAWFHKLKEYLLVVKFVVSKSDASLFVQLCRSTLLYVLVYVDDIIVTSNNSQVVDEFVQSLDSRFSLKDLGMLSYFLGIEVTYTSKVTYTSNVIFLNQRKYILDLL